MGRRKASIANPFTQLSEKMEERKKQKEDKPAADSPDLPVEGGEEAEKSEAQRASKKKEIPAPDLFVIPSEDGSVVFLTPPRAHMADKIKVNVLEVLEKHLPKAGCQGKLFLGDFAKAVHCSRGTLVQALKKIEIEGVFKLETHGKRGSLISRLK
jgi:hypothetical protein